MDDELKTKEQLISELKELRRLIGSYEEATVKQQQLNAALFDSRENYRSILEASPN